MENWARCTNCRSDSGSSLRCDRCRNTCRPPRTGRTAACPSDNAHRRSTPDKCRKGRSEAAAPEHYSPRWCRTCPPGCNAPLPNKAARSRTERSWRTLSRPWLADPGRSRRAAPPCVPMALSSSWIQRSHARLRRPTTTTTTRSTCPACAPLSKAHACSSIASSRLNSEAGAPGSTLGVARCPSSRYKGCCSHPGARSQPRTDKRHTGARRQWGCKRHSIDATGRRDGGRLPL